MASNFELNATRRNDLGKSHTNRLRRLEGLMPAIIYGGDNEPKPINIIHNQISKETRNEAFFSRILTINVDGEKEQVVVKNIQRHPYKKEIMHMDFLRVRDKDAITMKVPLHFSGGSVAPGVKAGGSVSHLMTEIELKCLPKDLPEFISVDISTLELDQSIHLSDLDIPDNLEIVQLTHGVENDLPVVSIHKVREQAVEEPESTEDDTDTEAENTETTSQEKPKQENS